MVEKNSITNSHIPISSFKITTDVKDYIFKYKEKITQILTCPAYTYSKQ